MDLQISPLPWHVSGQTWLYDLEFVVADMEQGKEGSYTYLAEPGTSCHMFAYL